jgi:hypothetical protein
MYRHRLSRDIAFEFEVTEARQTGYSIRLLALGIALGSILMLILFVAGPEFRGRLQNLILDTVLK